MTGSESWLKRFQKIIIKNVARKLLGGEGWILVYNYLEILGQYVVSLRGLSTADLKVAGTTLVMSYELTIFNIVSP